MSKRLVLTVGGVIFGAMWVYGIFGLVTGVNAHLVPTPIPIIVSGVFAMFATAGIFVLGFVQAASVSNKLD